MSKIRRSSPGAPAYLIAAIDVAVNGYKPAPPIASPPSDRKPISIADAKARLTDHLRTEGKLP